MKKLYIVLLSCFFGLSSCDTEEFLDEPKPSASLGFNDIFSSREGVEAYFAGIHRRARGQYTRTDAGGIYSMYFARTIKGTDLIQKSTWFRFDYNHENREPSYTRTTFNWNYSYDMINHANTLIKGVAESSLSDIDKAELDGQAKLLRAFYYFQLVLEYQQSYELDPSASAPPLYPEPSAEAKGMSTMQEVYALILKDLEDAKNVGDSRFDRSFVNVEVVNAIKARVLMAMNQNWDQVQKAANAAYGGDVEAALFPETYGEGFDDFTNKEWIWGLNQTADQTNYYYAAPHVFSDHTTLSYYATYVDKDFVALFSDSDVRNTFENLYELSDWREYVTHKFKFSFEADMPIVRTAEMILVESEAHYHLGNEAKAHELLYALQSNRDPEAVKSSNAGQNLFEEILVERRKELYGEMGVEWFDAKRLQRGLKRSENHRTQLEITPNDKRFFLKIPQSEIDANELIDESVNEGR